MEIHRFKKVQTQVAKAIILSFVFAISVSCSKNGRTNSVSEQETSQITRGKTKDGSSIIVGHCHDFGLKGDVIPAVLNINGVVLETNNGYFEYNVWPGNYDMRVGFIGKRWTSKSIKIDKGDSVNITFYLRDDDTPLYEK